VFVQWKKGKTSKSSGKTPTVLVKDNEARFDGMVFSLETNMVHFEEPGKGPDSEMSYFAPKTIALLLREKKSRKRDTKIAKKVIDLADLAKDGTHIPRNFVKSFSKSTLSPGCN